MPYNFERLNNPTDADLRRALKALRKPATVHDRLVDVLDDSYNLDDSFRIGRISLGVGRSLADSSLMNGRLDALLDNFPEGLLFVSVGRDLADRVVTRFAGGPPVIPKTRRQLVDFDSRLVSSPDGRELAFSGAGRRLASSLVGTGLADRLVGSSLAKLLVWGRHVDEVRAGAVAAVLVTAVVAAQIAYMPPTGRYDLSILEHVADVDVDRAVRQVRQAIPNIDHIETLEQLQDLAASPPGGSGRRLVSLLEVYMLEDVLDDPLVGVVRDRLTADGGDVGQGSGGLGVGVATRTGVLSPVLLAATVAQLTFDPDRIEVVFDLPARIDVVAAVLRDLHTLTEAAGLEDARVERVEEGSITLIIAVVGGLAGLAALLRVPAQNRKDDAEAAAIENKTEAETEKLRAEARKIDAETLKILIEARQLDPGSTDELVGAWSESLESKSDSAAPLREALREDEQARNASGRLAQHVAEVTQLAPRRQEAGDE